MITMRDEVSAIVSAITSHVVRTIIYLSFFLVWKSKQCVGILCPCITYFTLWPVLSQMSMTTEIRPTMSVQSPTQTKIEPTVSILCRHKLSAPAPAPVWKSKHGKSGHEKTPHPRKGRGFDLLGLTRPSHPSQGGARQIARAWRES